MAVLVAVASKHGATREIADEIGAGLVQRGVEAEVRDAGDVARIEPYEAVVLGSAVYAGHWLKPARELVLRHVTALARRPVWLFSSGPVGEPLAPADDAVDVAGVMTATGALTHLLLPGRLERDRLSFAERAITRALRGAEGDYRDWAAVDAFAEAIAERVLARREAGARKVPDTGA